MGAAPSTGFTDSSVQFYGEVRQVSGAQTVLLQSGRLEMAFVNQSDPSNRVTVETSLRPVGAGITKAFSYAVRVPLAYLPEAPRKSEFLAIGSEPTDFRIEEIKIDGVPATLPDGSKEFYGLSFASRSEDYQLDLIVEGSSTDTDNDGLPDWWEDIHGLNSSLADAQGDLDSDGWTNLQEFRFGSDPNISNRDPQLATAEIVVPESGVSGIYLHILDSDSNVDEINLEFSGIQEAGFQIFVDGVVLAGNSVAQMTLGDVQSGRFSVAHLDQSQREFTLPISWNDGGKMSSGEVAVIVVAPSTGDGNDTSLWLDGKGLGVNGAPLATWFDRSGNNRNASQPTAEYQPVISGDAVDFSAADSAHLFFSDEALVTGPHTVLASYKAAASSDSAQTLFSTNRGYLNVAPTSRPISYAGAPGYQMDGLAVRGYRNNSGEATTSIFRREGTLLQNIYGLSYDGENVAPTTVDPVLPTIGARRAAIGAGSNPVDEVFDGQIHELLVFPLALPEQKLRDVHDYLNSKWGDAVIWDLSTGLKSVTLSGGSSSNPQIIRGGHGDDVLGGGSADDIISGGPGADVLSGGAGRDRFVFGGVDTGSDTILDFDMALDVVDLSALFWGQTGDARDYLTIRLDTDFFTEVPTLNSVLLVQPPGGDFREITLKNTVIGSEELIQLVVEGRIDMGGLSIPSDVQISLAAGDQGDSFEEPFMVVLSRSGEGAAGAIDIPIGFFEESLGGRFVIDEATTNEKRRSEVHFARGETEKALTVRPVPDLKTTGSSALELAVLPHFKYTVTGSSVERVIRDQFNVWLEVLQSNAVADLSQPARVRIYRDGDFSEALTVSFGLSGTAEPGVHLETLGESLTIPVGQSYGELLFTARAAGLSEGARVLALQLNSDEGYQLGNPSEALLYLGATSAETNNAGFDRWLTASTGGALSGLADLAGSPQEKVNRYVQAYAYGQGSVDGFSSPHISFQIVDGRPEILANSVLRFADVRWGVQSAGKLSGWLDQSAKFTGSDDATGSKFVGEELSPSEKAGLYRLTMDFEAGIYTNANIAALSGSSNFGTSGHSVWIADHVSSDLTSLGGNVGDVSRIVAELNGDGSLNFELEIVDGDGSLAFYIDGVKQAETSGDVVAVQKELAEGSHLLMWQFTKGSGNAVIRNLGK